MMVTELKVAAIENGTVIDHIPPKNVFSVIKLLNLENIETQLFVGTNLDSKKYGKKGIIKVSNKFFESVEVNKIALVAPNATLIVIKNFQVVDKKQVEAPKEITKFVKCFNPNCITNHENITTHFTVISQEEIKLRCHYCEKITDKRNISFI